MKKPRRSSRQKIEEEERSVAPWAPGSRMNDEAAQSMEVTNSWGKTGLL